METKNLDFKIIIEIEDLNLKLENFDIDFKIKKDSKLEPDYACIYIWNLDDTTYHKILLRSFKANIYAITQNNIILFFSGWIDLESIYRSRIMVHDLNILNDGNYDICTYIKLIDSKQAYCTPININYREKVSSTRIITDCLEAMGIPSSTIQFQIPEKYYDSYKAKGNAHVVLNNICKALNIELTIQNEVIKIKNTNSLLNYLEIEEFDISNSSSPILQGNNEFTFYSKKIPTLNPLDLIYCNFEYFNGIYQLSKINFYGNNYNHECTTKLTIGL